eukprot:TRINITY_DN2008_c0_g1_i1.p1 TRINITY_DN2008_c0_g1~~TRINITY_DN2008_c0_g1_i1.p1  ORF type:complete len:321 (+),score=73.23 TRINITY_DN2008_c0_g1_i1:1189-2151(+)
MATAQAPSGIADKINLVLEKAAPLLVVLSSAVNTLGPHVIRLWELLLVLWVSLTPYHYLFPSIVGLCMAFFGGHYVLTFAAIEAYRMCGMEETTKHLIALYDDYLKVREVNEKDNLVDDNNDGIADVKQISSKELVTRKLQLLLKSIDPVKVSNSFSGLWMGFLGVVAVLRVQFARTVALGATIGGIFQRPADVYLSPILEKVIPTEYHKWNQVIINYTCKIIGVSIAWSIQRVISAWYTGIRGGQMFAIGFLTYLETRKIIPKFDEGSHLFSIIVGLVAVIGVSWQLKTGFSLPFPFNLFLLPVTIVEYFLTWMVAVEN